MKRNFYKKPLATALAVGMAISMSVPTFADVTLGEQAAIEGTSTVQAPITDMLIPTSATFLIDPYQMASIAANSQISAAEPFGVMNLSNIPVMFSVSATATLKPGVTLKPMANVTVDDVSNVSKQAYFALTPADATHGLVVDDSTATAPVFNFDTTDSGALGTYAATDALLADIAPVAAGKKPAKLTFALEKAVYDDDDALVSLDGTDATKNYTAFSYFGKINPSAAWADDDIKSSLVFDIRGVSDSAYLNLTTNNLWTAGAHNTLGVYDAENKATADAQIAVVPSANTYSKATKPNIDFAITNGTGANLATSIKSIKIVDSAAVAKTWDGAVVTNAVFTGLTNVRVMGAGAIGMLATGTANVTITFGTAGADATWTGTITINN